MKTPLEKYNDEIDRVVDNLVKVQKTCVHPVEMVTVKYRKDTGNWDVGDNRSWVEYKCYYCGCCWESSQVQRNKWTDYHASKK